MAEPAAVWALVLNWNGLAATRACVAALRGQGLTRLLVIDNGSTDGSTAALERSLDPDELLALPTNGGFGAGMNAGAREAIAHGATHLLFVNNDAVLGRGCTETLVAALDADPRAAAAAPTIFHGHPPDRSRVWYAGGTLGAYTAVTRHRHTAQGGPPHAVGFATACCLLVRADAWEALGGFPEDYFMYFEDAAWCERATTAGWRLLHVPAALSWHEGGGATGSQGHKAPALDYYDLRNGLAFIGEHRRGLAKWAALLYFWGWRVPRKLARILLRAPDRMSSLRAMNHGLLDAGSRQVGPYTRSRR